MLIDFLPFIEIHFLTYFLKHCFERSAHVYQTAETLKMENHRKFYYNCLLDINKDRNDLVEK